MASFAFPWAVRIPVAHVLVSIWCCQDLGSGHSNKHVLEEWYLTVNVQRPDDLWHAVSSHMLTCHLLTFLGSVSIHICCLFFKTLFIQCMWVYCPTFRHLFLSALLRLPIHCWEKMVEEQFLVVSDLNTEAYNFSPWNMVLGFKFFCRTCRGQRWMRQVSISVMFCCLGPGSYVLLGVGSELAQSQQHRLQEQVRMLQ